MIRGAIDFISANEIGGWIYSDRAELTGSQVLAFVDDRCVGAGRIDRFRPDLKAAGLGDGNLGFRFSITLASAEDVPRVIVRLDSSDAALLQSGSRVVGRQPPATGADPRRRPQSLQWLRAKGWLEQEEYDFFAFLDRFGIYDRTLGGARRDGEPEAVAAEAAKTFLDLYDFDEIELQTRHLSTIAELGGVMAGLAGGSRGEAILALWSPARASLGVVEGSHHDAEASLPAGASKAAVDHVLGPDRLLFLHSCVLTAVRGAPAAGLTVFHTRMP